jgi:hypothetical protein
MLRSFKDAVPLSALVNNDSTEGSLETIRDIQFTINSLLANGIADIPLIKTLRHTSLSADELANKKGKSEISTVKIDDRLSAIDYLIKIALLISSIEGKFDQIPLLIETINNIKADHPRFKMSAYTFYTFLRSRDESIKTLNYRFDEAIYVEGIQIFSQDSSERYNELSEFIAKIIKKLKNGDELTASEIKHINDHNIKFSGYPDEH